MKIESMLGITFKEMLYYKNVRNEISKFWL